MTDRYILNDAGEPVPEPDLYAWGKWYDEHDRHVGADQFGPVRVSTVFLGLDHKFSIDAGPPVLWETMIFGGPHDQYQERYRSRTDALSGHARACFLVQETVSPSTTDLSSDASRRAAPPRRPG